MTTAPIVVKQASGLDVLAALPAQLGFYPEDSAVLCALQPPNGRLEMVIRVDRSELGKPDAISVLSQHAEAMRHRGATGIFAVRYAPPAASALPNDVPFWNLLQTMNQAVPVCACWDVQGQVYQEFDPERRSRLGPKYTLKDVQSTRAAALVAAEGLVPKARRKDLASIVPASKTAIRTARSAERRALDQSLALEPEALSRWRLRELDSWLLWVEKLQEDPSLKVPSAVLGRFSALIQDTQGRDAVLATPFAGGGHARLVALGLSDGAIFDPVKSSGVEGRQTQVCLDLVHRLLAHIPPRRRGAGYALGAALYWWLGSGAEAEQWANAALDCADPPRLAALVADAVHQGFFPQAVTGGQLAIDKAGGKGSE